MKCFKNGRKIQHILCRNKREVGVTRFHTEGSEVIKNRTDRQKREDVRAHVNASKHTRQLRNMQISTARASLKSDELGAVPALKRQP